ncbi:MAG: hypothetical protein V4629_04595 [Pseudomonadota bacterium]
MENLFQFILARPVQQVDPKNPTINVRPSPELEKKIKDAKNSENPLPYVHRVAKAYIHSEQALYRVEDLTHGQALLHFLEALKKGNYKTLNELHALVKKLFNSNASDLVKTNEWLEDQYRISDALVINTIFGSDVLISSIQCAELLKAMAIISRVANGDATVGDEITQSLEATLILPKDIFPIAARLTPSQPSTKPSIPNTESVDTLKTKRETLLSTYNMLTRVSPDNIAIADTKHSDIGNISSTSAYSSLPPIVAKEYEEDDREDSISRFDTIRSVIKPSLSGKFSHTLVKSMVLRDEVMEAIGAAERAVLEERQLDLTQVPLNIATDRLSIELGDIELKLMELTTQPHTMMKKIGSSYIDNSFLESGLSYKGELFNAVPHTHGSLAPVGIGDLLVVKQNLKRYEARELAHVENVLMGEYKERSHLRSRTTEETFTVETEIKKEEERDQQTTERFELKTESSQIQKEDSSLKIGLALSGKYGPVVEFKASTDFALNTSKEEASKVATSYSKDVTNRATSRIFERRTEQRILKTIEVFEEKNTHGIDNKGGTGHVVGQYQWIDKVYEAQVFNYGKRMLFDIMLPEPAAFLIHAMSNQPATGNNLIKPTPFTLSPTDINEWNYSYYVKQYEVIGVLPPPQPYITVSKAFEGIGKQNEGSTKAAEIPIGDGYQALSSVVLTWFNRWSGGIVDVSLGTRMKRFSDNDSWSINLNNEVGSIQFTMKTLNAAEYVVGLEVYCQRTARHLDDWRLKTHAAIVQAYQKLLRDYEEKLAALQVQAAQQIQGRNPEENSRLIRSELKKGATSVFTAQHFDLFGAINSGGFSYPEINFNEAEAEGKYIRFFEQAFEWEQMMYFFYPYYWGRKSNWLKRALMQDVDPLFAEFIKAGAARVVLSVRPGFEKAVAHYFSTGQIWNGGDLPDITSPLYVSIIDEIRERDKAPGLEVAQGDPWEVRLPTTLVILREKPGLPKWQKNAQGEWLPKD